jgi:hypothetical protein
MSFAAPTRKTISGLASLLNSALFIGIFQSRPRCGLATAFPHRLFTRRKIHREKYFRFDLLFTDRAGLDGAVQPVSYAVESAAIEVSPRFGGAGVRKVGGDFNERVSDEAT